MASNIQFASEVAGSIPVASAPGKVRLFRDIADGLFKFKDNIGNITTLGGGGALVWVHRAPVIGPAVQLAVIYETVKVDPTAGIVMVNLPTAVGFAGQQLKVVSLTDMIGPPAVNIIPDGSETINGDPSKSLTTPRERMTLESDGANWLVVD
jgi:hypothetical protein